MDPIRLRICQIAPLLEDRIPGDMWRWRPGDIPGRMCWWIILPPHPDIGTPGHPGELSWRTTDRASDGQRWQVTGTAPLLTVEPSIDIARFVPDPTNPSSHVQQGSYWHGWIRNGYLEPA